MPCKASIALQSRGASQTPRQRTGQLSGSLHHAPAAMLPSDSGAAVTVPISAQTALGELLPGVGGCGEAMGLAWRRLGVTWTYSGGFRFGLGVIRDSRSERQVNVLSLSFLFCFPPRACLLLSMTECRESFVLTCSG